MEPEPTLGELSQKIDAVYVSVEKTRMYFKWTLITTVVAFVLPLLAALFIVPSVLSEYTQTINTLVQ